MKDDNTAKDKFGFSPIVRDIFITFGIFIAAAIGFTALADEVLDGDTTTFDESVLISINENSSPNLDQLFLVVTELGGFVAVPVIGLIAAVWLWKTGRKYALAVLTAGVGGAAAINILLKFIFERPRPDLWEQIVVETFFSFPSGHAMASSALALCLIVITWKSKWRMPTLVLGVIYVLLVGFSRLYLGVHYPTDVIGGWLISLAWVAIVTALVYGYLYRRSSRRREIAN